ncbi:MAG TPA: hypothetical protein VLA20_00615 [Vicinamibacterales bacterium]|nr:hypothetical protein [Vicinamibacterales bacterium]
MDVSDFRKRIIHALDDARRDAEAGRQARKEAGRVWEAFLADIAVPLFRQASQVLRAEGHLFSVETPAETVRLVSDGSSETFLELMLDMSAATPQVVGRLSVGKGRGRQLVDERVVAPGKGVEQLDEADLADFLVTAVPALIVRP